MKIRRIIGATMALSVASLGVLVAAPEAHALGNKEVGRQYGDVLRGRIWSDHMQQGFVLTTYGSSPCSGSTSDIDTQQTALDYLFNNWDNVASSAADYNLCDTRLYPDKGLGGIPLAGNFDGLSGKYANLPSLGFNDVTSSYYLT